MAAFSRTTRHPAQWLALVIGVVYTLVGLIGFLVTGFDNFAGVTNDTLLGFELNPLHNLVHLAIGVLGVVMWTPLASARTYGWLLAAIFGLAFVFGMFAVSNVDINILSINGPDNILHLLSAAAGVLVALWPARRGILGRRG